MICLQGGAEFGPACAEMDRELLALSASGPVVVLPVASARPRDYELAGRHGVAHFRSLGGADVATAPDPRTDPAGTVAAVRSAAMLVLPGGSPARAREALVNTELGDAVAASEALIVGASAGAMVLCAWLLVPERWPAVLPGLGLVPDVLVIPHYQGPRPDWERAARSGVPAGVDLLGIPECSGVLVESGRLRSLGVGASLRLPADGEPIRLPT